LLATTPSSITLARVNPHRISFARTLPILALLLSYVLIAVPATRAYFYFSRASQHGRDLLVPHHGSYIRIPHEHFLRTSVLGSAELTEPAIVPINFPGGFIDLAVQKKAGTWPHGWSPQGISVPAWKAIILPIFCLPFWWLAGLGIDSLFRPRQLRWWALLSGSVFWAFYLLAAVGLVFNVLVAKDHYPSALAYGVGLWFILLAAFPITWVQRLLALRRIKTSLHARLSAETQ
jgi:hypothetical protein